MDKERGCDGSVCIVNSVDAEVDNIRMIDRGVEA